MSGRRFSVDESTSTVLITCAECEHWQALRFTREEAWRAARAHEERVHPGATQATTALAYYRDTP